MVSGRFGTNRLLRTGWFHMLGQTGTRDLSFGQIYRRLVGGLGAVLMGGWVALYLNAAGQGIAALVALIVTGMLAAWLAGRYLSGFVALEAAGLVVIAVQIPLLVYVWADTGPLTLIGVAALQYPIAFLAGQLIRRRRARG